MPSWWRGQSRAIEGDSWQAIVDSLPAVARQAQEKRITTFSASLAARLELALCVVRQADGIESACEGLYQRVGAGTSTLESVPCAIAMVELAGGDLTAAPFCAQISVAIPTPSAQWQLQFAVH